MVTKTQLNYNKDFQLTWKNELIFAPWISEIDIEKV